MTTHGRRSALLRQLRAAHRRRTGAGPRRRDERGQAAIALVLGLILLLSWGGGILATSALQHDPLVQNDAVQHYAYRAVEAGVSTYLSTINADPNLVNCNSGNAATVDGVANPPANVSPLCTGIAASTWTQVPGTGSNGVVPEWYKWGNPQFCFTTTDSSSCLSPSDAGNGTLAYVEVQIIGAAGFPSHYVYNSLEAKFTPANGFLTHIWWSNYEATDPTLSSNPNAINDCTWDWNNNWQGPDKTNPGNYNGSNCAAVFFGPNDQVYGPVYSNDSIYVANDPTFNSTVTTHDPSCLFVDPLVSGEGGPPSAGYSPGCASAAQNAAQGYSANSSFNAPFEPLPTDDSSLGAIAAQGGCLYSGPTTIEFYKDSSGTPYMMVTSPDTPLTNTGADANNDASNATSCGGGTTTPTAVKVPDGPNGNGVVFVQNTSGTSCKTGANPFDGSSSTTTSSSQTVTTSTSQTLGTYKNQYGIVTPYYDGNTGTSNPDCEGDVFVSNYTGGSGNTPGLSGLMTVASQNDVVVTGNVTYLDCGGGFNSQNNCPYATGAATNDGLGLIAYNDVEVDHPMVTTTTTSTYQQCSGWVGHQTCTQTTSTSTSEALAPACGQSGAPAAPLCTPPGNFTIDAAILALNGVFAVNNYTEGGAMGTLDVYGAIDQDWRGAVGLFSGNSSISGYTKYYLWDNRLEYLTPPAYLAPGTPSWTLASSAAATQSSSPPSCLPPWGTTGTCTTGTPT